MAPRSPRTFPIYCGGRSPTTLDVELERLDPSVAAEQVGCANLLYLNAERKRGAGSPSSRGTSAPPTWRSDTARTWRANEFVGHTSPRTGDVSQRFERAKISGSVVRENVARGYGPKGIHRSLMSSPGHRVNVVASDVTHIGIGVVIGASRKLGPRRAAPGVPDAESFPQAGRRGRPPTNRWRPKFARWSLGARAAGQAAGRRVGSRP